MNYTPINPPTVITDGHAAAVAAADALGIVQTCEAAWEHPAGDADPWLVRFFDSPPDDVDKTPRPCIRTASVARDGTVTEL